jgi:hypothetical protein
MSFAGLAPYVQRFPEKVEAWRLYRIAMYRGELRREPCEVCGAEAQGHHDDYAKPLVIRWLCRVHHVEWHHEHGPGLNGGDEAEGKYFSRGRLLGKVFGTLRVVSEYQHRADGHILWVCACACGDEVLRTTSSLNAVLLNGSGGA